MLRIYWINDTPTLHNIIACIQKYKNFLFLCIYNGEIKKQKYHQWITRVTVIIYERQKIVKYHGRYGRITAQVW